MLLLSLAIRHRLPGSETQKEPVVCCLDVILAPPPGTALPFFSSFTRIFTGKNLMVKNAKETESLDTGD